MSSRRWTSPRATPGPLGSPRAHTTSLIAVALLGLLAVPQDGAASEVVTAQFQVNTVTGSAQYLPAVAADPDGNFILVWESYASASGGDSDGLSVQGTVAIGAQFQVNTSTTNNQRAPAVAIRPGGDSVVVWQSAHVDINNARIMAQRYDTNGVKVGAELTVGTGGNNVAPSVAMANNGDFVVVWRSNLGVGTDTGPSQSIQGRRFKASSGSFLTQFQVNDVTAGDQDNPVIATDGNGTYLVAWEEPATSTDIAVRYFTADNSADGMPPNAPQETANTYASGPQVAPAVAMAPDGRAVVVWETFGSSWGSDNNRYSIQYRRLDATGTFSDSDEVQANVFGTDDQRFPAVAMDGSGFFSVVWQSYNQPGDLSDYSIQLRSYTAAGDPLDALDVQANEVVTSTQSYPAQAFFVDGVLLTAWQSNGTIPGGTDTNGFSIQGTLVDVLLFADGFEMGDTSRWTATVQ